MRKFLESEAWKYIRTFLEIVLIVAIAFLAVTLWNTATAEEDNEEEPQYIYVMSKTLYGRIRPGKKYEAVKEFEFMTPLQLTGRVSDDHEWVEVVTSENELVWCNINYISERVEVIHVYSLNDQAIKIRKHPGYGKVTGYARKNQILEITQVVMGYGKCKKGWVDLSYFIEDYE